MGQTNCYPQPKEKVWWKIDKQNITVHMYPKKRGYTYKPYTKHWKNICTSSTCKGRKGTLYCNQAPVKTLKANHGVNGRKCSPEGQITCSVCDADYCGVSGKDAAYSPRFNLKSSSTPSVGEVVQGKTNNKIILDSTKTGATLAASTTGSTSEGSGGNLSSWGTSVTAGTEAANSEKTYEDILKEFSKTTDSIFFVRNGILCFATFPGLVMIQTEYYKYGWFKEDRPITKDVIEDGSYEIDVAEWGYYNTVYVKYKGGKAKAFHSELVRIYDEVPITYNEPNIDAVTAQTKAEAYLSAHIRDFDMSVDFNMLTTGKLVPGHFTWIQDEKTNAVERYFTQSVSTQWSDGSTLTSSVKLKYGPKNPDSPYIPEVGVMPGSTVEVSKTEQNSESASVGSTGLAPDGQSGGCGADNAKMTQGIIDWAAKYKTPEQLCKAARGFIKPRYSGYECYRNSPQKILNGSRANCADGARFVVYACKANGWDAMMSKRVYCGRTGHRYAKIKGTNGTWKMCDTICSNPKPALPKAW